MSRVAIVLGRAGIVAAALVGACNGSSPVTMLYGEVHIHQFADGAHLSALFVRAPVAAASVPGDEILPLIPSTTSAGACTLTPLDAAKQPPAPALVDDGTLHLVAADGSRTVELVWLQGTSSYAPITPLPLGAPVFAGGVRIAVDGAGAVMPAFSGAVVTPQPLMLTEPHALAIPAGGDLAITWPPAGGERVTVDLVVSRSDGASMLIECRAADADGTVAVPRALLDALPPRPRDLQLEVSRDDIVRAPSRKSGQGVLLHAGFEVALAAHEP